MLHLFQVRQLMHHDHSQELGRRLPEQGSNPDFLASPQTATMALRNGSMETQRMFHHVQLTVIEDFVDKRRITQMRLPYVLRKVIQGLVGLYLMPVRIAPGQIVTQAVFGHELPHLLQQGRRIATKVAAQGIG